eukprot:929165_1
MTSTLCTLCLALVSMFIQSESSNCTTTDLVICITGSTSYNDWFYTEYNHTGCYGTNPYYYSTNNGYYIYWNSNYNRWQSYSALGSIYNAKAFDSAQSTSLFESNGQWAVNSPTVYDNIDPCLQIHASSCAAATSSTDCSNCNTNTSLVCIQGQTPYNDWFYTEYNYSGCYGTNPYYYSAINGHYIYWNSNYNRWQSYSALGSIYNAKAFDSSQGASLFDSNGEWSVNSPPLGDNIDPCLEIHDSSCSGATVPSACNCNQSISAICITGKSSYNDWFYTQYNVSGCYGSTTYYYSANNGYYIYWNSNYNRWQSYNVLGSIYNAKAFDTAQDASLFESNGLWAVNSPTVYDNIDPCLEIHAANKSTDCAAIQATDCNICTVSNPSICITGKTAYNDWFYTEYNHTGCYGT